ncbi:hypothetical protein [Tepidibacter hydrothermalis]|uniref:Uncharacterized protein n=1 Tax=Tepidibacter hydrothermalis TaxID=3036126 RepID=A0ABY8EBT4_9FIRM|nr:hypothetical protein [Tepidibacter hydrothermalis]WFD10359.1 hypothetical protein P4S50_19015 [Tepidibacter hydrothermalis]
MNFINGEFKIPKLVGIMHILFLLSIIAHFAELTYISGMFTAPLMAMLSWIIGGASVIVCLLKKSFVIALADASLVLILFLYFGTLGS